MLSVEDAVSLRARKVATFFGERRENSAPGSVGVGGVTKVVGVSVRLGGVAGKLPVFTRGLPRACGVTGRSVLCPIAPARTFAATWLPIPAAGCMLGTLFDFGLLSSTARSLTISKADALRSEVSDDACSLEWEGSRICGMLVVEISGAATLSVPSAVIGFA